MTHEAGRPEPDRPSCPANMRGPDSRRRADQPSLSASMTTSPPGREQLADQVTGLIDAGDLRRALAACKHLNQGYPDYAYGWYLASYLMKKVRHFDDALRAVERALELSAEDKYALHKAKCLFESGQVAAASELARQVHERSFPDASLHGELGTLFHMLGDHPRALDQYCRAIELDGSNAQFHFNKAAVLRYLGNAAGAETAFDRAIELNPQEYEAYNGRAQLRTQTRERNHVVELRATLASSRPPAGQVQLHYALAKELEDLGDYVESFASLKRGADIKRRHMQYSVDTDLQIIGKIREIFGPGMLGSAIEGCNGPGAIFIIGMPRTGTTLVERILGSHSTVHSAGELNNFGLELIRLGRQAAGGAPASRLDFVAATAKLDFRKLGEAYLDSVEPLRGGATYFIDKLPFNYLYAGLIHLALPQAKIINLQRHPMDTCYAIYKQLFKDAYPFSYDLAELGQYYIAYHRLMQHWNGVMPGVIHTLRYEALVADVEAESRRLLEYCGLPWEAACLRYHQSPESSTTASALQVRQPVYGSSVGKWRCYAGELESLRQMLVDAGIDAN